MIKVENSTVTFEEVYKSSYAPKDDELKEANLLLIPYHNYRPNIEYCFGEYSEEFLRYVKKDSYSNIKPDIAITDEKYQMMEMHSLLIDIGVFLVTSVVLPVAVNVLSSYIYDKVKSLHSAPKDVDVKVEIISQNADGSSKSIKFDGPATEFKQVEEVAKKIIESK